jgi:hypothetical protein
MVETRHVWAGPLFVLAPPRSFTSVVGAMLGQHPQLYGLPETHLLSYETLAERGRAVAEAAWPMDDGLLRAVAELYLGGQTEATVRRAAGWLRRRRHLITGAVLEALAERVRPRAVVEKSPSLAWGVDWMRRAYALFPGARFVHLLRHPRAHGESVLKLTAVLRESGGQGSEHGWLRYLDSIPPPPEAGEDGGPAGGPDPQWAWYVLNRNIVDFLAGVPAAQVYRLRGEDVLADPDAALPPLAAWLGLRDDPEAVEEMKHPERSPFARFGPPGARFGNDSFFLERPVLRPGRAAPKSLDGPLPWRPDGRGFAPAVLRVARELGYT